MKKINLKIILILIITALFIGACEYNDPYGYPSYGSPQPYYGGSYDNGYYARREAERARDERYKLDRERYKLDEERRRLEEQQRQQQQAYRPPPVRESCPPGFSPSERKCSNDERRHGCRDIRLPSGLGCVSR